MAMRGLFYDARNEHALVGVFMSRFGFLMGWLSVFKNFLVFWQAESSKRVH